MCYKEAGAELLLTFAWEKDPVKEGHLNHGIEIAKKFAEQTEVLVIIGYSFPFFNREIDNQIFEAIKKGGKLSKNLLSGPNKDW